MQLRAEADGTGITTPDRLSLGGVDTATAVPLELTITPAARRHAAVWPINVHDFGAVGYGLADCTSHIQAAINRCAEAGGGTVLVPAGKFLSGALWLRSHVTLQLEAGARLTGIHNVAAFPARTSRWEGPRVRPMHAGLINGEDLEDIAIVGRGTINGGGSFWWDLFKRGELEYERPKLIRLINCRNVLIDGITCSHSPMWTINPVACDNVSLTRLTIYNPEHSPNTDGINPDSCANVRITDCHIDVGDDCVAIKSGTEKDGRLHRKACENIIVSGCTMLHGHGGVVIGSEISGGVRNVSIGNCVFSGTERGIRIKARRGRGAGVEDVRVSNIVMDDVMCPIVVNLFYECGVEDPRLVSDLSPHPVTSATPRFRRLRFSQISARRVKYAAAFILGLPEMAIEDMILDNVSIWMDEQNEELGQPAMSPLAPLLCRAGMRIMNGREITLRSVDIRGHVGPAVAIENALGVIVRDVSGDVAAKMEVHLTGVSHARSDDSVTLVTHDTPAARNRPGI